MLLGLLALIFCALFAFLAWRRLDLTTAVIVFALPSYLIRFHVWFIPMTLLEAMVLILFAVFILRRRKIDFSDYKWPILLFLISTTAAVFVSSDKMAALGIWKAYFLEPILFFIVLINVVKSRKEWSLIVNALGMSAVAVAVPAVIQKFTGWGILNPFWFDETTRRVTSWYGYPNAVGLYLAPVAVLFFLLWIVSRMNSADSPSADSPSADSPSERSAFFPTGNSLASAGSIAVVVLSVLAIIFAKSEGALVGILAGLVFFGLLYPSKKIRLITFALLVSLVLLVSLIPLMRNYVAIKVTLSDRSGQIRVQQWKETWAMLKDGRIITGAGLAGYQNAVKPFHQEGIWIKDKNDPRWLDKIKTDEKFRQVAWQPTEIYLYPHNIFLNFWSETGLVGLAAVVLLLGRFFLAYRKLENNDDKKIYLILMSVMVAILTHGLVDVPYFKNDLSMLWWAIIGLGYVLIVKGKDWRNIETLKKIE